MKNRKKEAAISRPLKLVTKWCANYDKECGCLPLDSECYMLGKCWTGAYCRYFREAVLPLDPVLGPLCGNRSGIICVKSGADVWKIGLEKPTDCRAFRPAFRGGIYLSLSHPGFTKMLSTSYI